MMHDSSNPGCYPGLSLFHAFGRGVDSLIKNPHLRLGFQIDCISLAFRTSSLCSTFAQGFLKAASLVCSPFHCRFQFSLKHPRRFTMFRFLRFFAGAAIATTLLTVPFMI